MSENEHKRSIGLAEMLHNRRKMILSKNRFPSYPHEQVIVIRYSFKTLEVFQ